MWCELYVRNLKIKIIYITVNKHNLSMLFLRKNYYWVIDITRNDDFVYENVYKINNNI